MSTASIPDFAKPRRILRANDNFRWPAGKRIAVVFNIAFEGWSDGVAPPIGPMGNVLKPGFFDTNAHSWASFGINRGIHRLARIAASNGIRTSVMTNGVIAERAPETVRQLADDGHDVYAHSWGMDIIPVYLDEAGERENLERNTRVMTDVLGERPVGWISPRGTGSLITPALLAEAGYVWHGDCNDDDLPAIAEFSDGNGGARSIVQIPLTMDVNDLPHSIRYGNAPGDLAVHFEDILSGTAEADPDPFMLDVTAHTHVFGRAAGAWAYHEMMVMAKEHPDVWIATRREIADYVLDNAETMFE
ncbi:MAG: polysaccharide deacetylase family protein [Hyphomicrobiales bacterium]|nr:polysaccharide deacetylase family protein [Hyphomicrobiales bacterium]